MMHVNEMDAHRGKSASKQNDNIVTRWTIEHLDLTPKQLIGAIAFIPVMYLMVLIWTVI